MPLTCQRLTVYFAAVLLLLSGCAGTSAEPAPDMHTSRNALDWQGAYSGILPCADCEGVETTVTLMKNNQYSRQLRYKGKSEQVFHEQGRFVWDNAGRSVILQGKQEKPRYQVGEGYLLPLDVSGGDAQGATAENYRLLKRGEPPLTETYWKLTQLNGEPVQPSRSEPHIILKEDGRMVGAAGCNRILGSYVTDSQKSLRFSKIAGGKMTCLDSMAGESAMLSALEQADSYVIRSNTLTLHRGQFKTLARFEVVYLY